MTAFALSCSRERARRSARASTSPSSPSPTWPTPFATAPAATTWPSGGFAEPVIAAVDGAALGGGFDLYLLCDIRIATPDAVFAHPEIKFGAAPLFTPLQWILGAGIARDLCLTGRRIDAAEAHRIGLVNTIADADSLLDEAIATARVIAEPQAALEATKRYLTSSAGVTFDQAFAVEHDRVFDEFLLGAFGPGPAT
jgi:enoyl-CoA hydratase/carnithine racemase